MLNTLQGCRQTSSSPRRAYSLTYRCLRPDGKGSRRLREAFYTSHKLPVAAVKGGVLPEAEPHGASCDFQSTGGYVCLLSLQTSTRGMTVWEDRAHNNGTVQPHSDVTVQPHGSFQHLWGSGRRNERAPRCSSGQRLGAEGRVPSVTPCSVSS